MNMTMDAAATCEILLSTIRASNLNFSSQETPFSVLLSIRKSFIKAKNVEILPSYLKTSAPVSVKDLEIKINYLETKVGQLQAEKEESNSTINDLANKLEKAKTTISDMIIEKKKMLKTKDSSDKKLDDKELEVNILKTNLKT